jgi:hypothetical protein
LTIDLIRQRYYGKFRMRMGRPNALDNLANGDGKSADKRK